MRRHGLELDRLLVPIVRNRQIHPPALSLALKEKKNDTIIIHGSRRCKNQRKNSRSERNIEVLRDRDDRERERERERE
jgi:hypothetical protein